VNEEMVRQGYACAFTRYPFRYMDRYRELERDARAAGRGLWALSEQED
jgi:endonuclease YncB( thermonuclease family)